jgi:hypothetical protein
MTLQNRVDAFGAIHAVPARGGLTGNRGVIHDPATRQLLRRRWSTRAWIICALEHPRGHVRVPMGRNARSGGAGWTELFFLDEVTALSAGHRPCFYCRRAAAKAFVDSWRMAEGDLHLPLAELDRRLHGERIASGGVPVPLDRDQLESLPDGAMVAAGDQAFAWRSGRQLPWSFAGYGRPVEEIDRIGMDVRLLTPASTVAALRAGYRPAWHESAQA